MSEPIAEQAPDGGYVVGDYVPDRVLTAPVIADRWTWLTPQLRAAIYSAMVAVGGVFTLLGIVTQEQWGGIVDVVDALFGLLLFGTAAMALLHTPKV